MNKKYSLIGKLSLGFLGLLSFSQVLNAQTFVYNNGDMLLGFRKTGVNQANFEMLVNIGSLTNFENMASGSVTNLSNYYAPAQLSMSFSNYNNLNWSVSGTFPGNSTFAGYPRATLWLTNPRTTQSLQTTPYVRANLTTEQNIRQNILGIGGGGVQISLNLGSGSTNNTVSLVREPINDPNGLTAFIGGADPTNSDYQGQWTQSAEAITPASFNSPVRSDLYEVRPTGTVDPHSGLTTGDSYFVGYFELATNGMMTFTRATTNNPAPPAPVLTFGRSGNTSTITFATTNGATYNLIFTNVAGLSSARSNWPTIGGSIVGAGGSTNFTDTTTDSDRVYSVKAH